MDDTHISLAHGNGGRFMRELIREIFQRHLGNPDLDINSDAVTLTIEGSEIMFTTDGFSVQPLEFPGGDIGSLAVHGTVNDLAVSGAEPLYLSLNAFIEEGLKLGLLDRLVKSLAETAEASGVRIVAGDTKVVPRGHGGGLYLATTGIGRKLSSAKLSLENIEPGDAILVSGPVGDHGTAVMLAREAFGLRGDIQSDAASVLPLTRSLLNVEGLRFMRDPTRGGLATVMHEICHATGFGVRLEQSNIPVQDPVQSVCDMLGYDPLFLACEGRVVAVVAENAAKQALTNWQQTVGGKDAAIIGRVEDAHKHVVLVTELGGERVLEELEDEPLPRIC